MNNPEVLAQVWIRNNATGNLIIGYVLIKNANDELIGRCGIGFHNNPELDVMHVAKYGGRVSDEVCKAFFGTTVKKHTTDAVRKRASNKKSSKRS